MNYIPTSYLPYLAPELLLTLWAMLLLLGEAFFSFSSRVVTAWGLVGILTCTLITLGLDPAPTLFWYNMGLWDGAAKFYHLFFLVTAALVLWMTEEVQEPMRQSGGEFALLPLFTTAGLMLLASSNDFTLLFIALELVTISFYILVAYQRRSPVALEAGVKYLILGALSSAFLVMGIAYIFGIAGSTRFDLITAWIQQNPSNAGINFGLLLLLTGIGFKIAMVPFHSWAPDVYEGAPTSITAFLSVGSKAGGLIILLRVVLGVFDLPATHAVWAALLAICAVLSLLVGNLAAIPQRNLKRLLAYSSIGHSGFILVAIIGATTVIQAATITANPVTGQTAVAVYLVSYLLASFTAFIVLAILERRLPGLEIHHLAGLAQRSPLLAAALALSLVSLAGVPPLSGFFAKFYVIIVAWNQGLHVLLGFVIFAAVAALYYYLGPIKAMYWSEPLDESPIRVSRATSGMLAVLMLLLIVTGFWAQTFAVLVNKSTLAQPAPPVVASLSR